MINKRIARVFPRKTKASPDDDMAFFTVPPLLILPEIDEVHVSVAFDYDIPHAEWLAEQWRAVGVPVRMGGPAYNEKSGDFTPGLYLRHGYTITSRGCGNACWFCKVHKREGPLRELPIMPGWNIMDDNILACSEKHIRAVFSMLKGQTHSPVFTGGLEARLLRAWHVDLLREVKARRFYFAYDEDTDYEPLAAAGRMLQDGGITAASNKAACYLLIGYAGDTMDKAEKRLRDTWAAGFVPYAMLYRDSTGVVDREWRAFQRVWLRPQIVMSRLAKDS